MGSTSPSTRRTRACATSSTSCVRSSRHSSTGGDHPNPYLWTHNVQEMSSSEEIVRAENAPEESIAALQERTKRGDVGGLGTAR